MNSLSRRSFLAHSLAAGGALAMGSHRLIGAPNEIYTTNIDPQDHHDPNLYLFLDDEHIHHKEHLILQMNKMAKHPTPILKADRPWEGERAQAWGSVIQEPSGLFRMWYFAFNTERRWDELDRGGYCYAESWDGIHWEKPDLGLFNFRGSKRNNIFYLCNPNNEVLVDEELARRGLGLPAIDERGQQIGVINNLDGLTVVRDDDDPDPQRRYKLIANMQDHRMWAYAHLERYSNVTEQQQKESAKVFGQYVDTSPDGIHWARKPRRIFAARGGDYMMVTRDHRNREWWLNERAHDQGGRNASLRTSKDWKNWSDLEVIFGRTSDPNFNKTFQWHGGITPFNYGQMNVGLLEKWPLSGRGADCELVAQREGGEWKRLFPGHAFMECGPEGAFDRVLAYPSHNSPGRMGDKLLFFYTGAGAKNHPRKGMPMAMGLATIGCDRFAGLAHWRNLPSGKVITKPLVVPGPHLAINVENLEHTPMRAAITDASGKAIPGYSFDDSRIELHLDHLYSWAQWRDKPDLTELVGQQVSLQLEVNGGILYSYRFYPQRATGRG